MNTILQAIKLAPRFLWQIYFHPSMVYDFIISQKRNAVIYIVSSFFQGLFAGIILAIPHLVIYNKHVSILFIFAFTIATVIASAAAFAAVFTGTIADIVAAIGIVTIGLSGLMLGGAVGASIAVGLSAAAISGAGAVIRYKKAKYSLLPARVDAIYSMLFFPLILILNFAIIYGRVSLIFKDTALFVPLAFLIGYTISESLSLSKNATEFQKKFKTVIPNQKDLFYTYLKRYKLMSLIWGPTISLSVIVPVYFKIIPNSTNGLLGNIIAFSIIPLFVLRIPDYCIFLPSWLMRLNKIKQKCKDPDIILKNTDMSQLFNNETIYWPLPKLPEIITIIAQNKKLGLKEAIKKISYLYLFTFQQKQAIYSLENIWKDKKNDHQLIHYLLETRNVAILEILAKHKLIIEPYLELVELLSNEKEEKPVPLKLDEGLAVVCRDMEKMNDHNHTREMVYSLDTARKLIAAGSIKDIYGAVGVLEIKAQFPDDPDYFKILNNTAAQLIQIKKDLKKAEAIENIDTKRTVLRDQQKRLEELTASTTAALYDPFETIWQKALTNCSRVIETEIDQLQGSAVFDVRLVNQELRIDHLPKQTVYFDVTNKGRELGRNVTFSIQTDGTALATPDHQPHVIDFFETGHSKKIQFPVTVHNPGKATVKLHLTYSDRTRENKQEIFSFPITITEKHTRFKKIKNPYTAGPALDSSSPLFMGRNDIYQFIDKNILPTGQHQHHTIVCHGLRRTGKSSLLYHIQNRRFTDPRLVPINIDLQGIADEKDLYLTLSEKILQTLPLSSDNPQPVDNFGDFKRFIHTLAPAHNKIPVLMLDEFEELQMRVQDNRISRSVFSNLRHLMQHQDRIIFIFCGTHKIEEMKADYWSIFFNTALYRRVGRLAKTDAVQLIREPVKDHLNYDELAVEHILTMTGRQPYLIQLICRTIVNDLNNTKKRNDALVNDVDDAVEQIIAEDNDNFSKEAWKEAGYLKRMILSATAEELTHQHVEQVHLGDILDKVAPLVPDFTREAGTDTLDQLVTHEILTEKNLNYRFTIDMMRKWIALKHPLRKVRA